ncbi:hypothetical protein [Luteolibacter marinus]|uniref:hypothetical protein n=1 Tax=Luteolibacter marinus TaxID=2776705 RepID=UPI001867698B|nr:hypothetical protein [Luteolibacter marinus]
MTTRGRPALEFDLGEVEKLGMLGATAAEIAAWFNCGLRTIERRMGKAEGDFRMAYDRGFGRLKISLRRQQIEAAKSGNTAMLIWLGKQLLDQADKREIKEESTVTQKEGRVRLTPEDEEFLRRKGRLVPPSGGVPGDQ